MLNRKTNVDYVLQLCSIPVTRSMNLSSLCKTCNGRWWVIFCSQIPFKRFTKTLADSEWVRQSTVGEGSDIQVPTSHLEEEPCHCQRECVHAAPSFLPWHRNTFLSFQTVFLFCEEQLVHYWCCTLTRAFFQKFSCLNYGSFKLTNSELGTSLWILGDIYQLRIQCMRTY